MSLELAQKMFRDNLSLLPPGTTDPTEMLWWNLTQGLLALAEGIADEAHEQQNRLAAIERALAQLKPPHTQ